MNFFVKLYLQKLAKQKLVNKAIKCTNIYKDVYAVCDVVNKVNINV